MSIDVAARDETPASGSEPPAKRGHRVLAPPVTGQEIVLVCVIAVLWIILGFATPAFVSAGSIQPLLGAVAPIALIGIGMTVVIITGGIDVSVGAAIAVCSVITAKLVLVQAGLSLPVAILISVVVGGLLGLLNGVLIAYGRVHAIIITFGTANIFQWISLKLFNSSTVNNIPDTLAPLGNGAAGRTLGVPNSFLITVVLVAIAWVYLRHTAGGRHLYDHMAVTSSPPSWGEREGPTARTHCLPVDGVTRRAGVMHRGGPGIKSWTKRRRRQGAGRDRRCRHRRNLHHWRARLGARHRARRAAGANRRIRSDAAGLAVRTLRSLRGHCDHHRRRRRPHPGAGEEETMSIPTAAEPDLTGTQEDQSGSPTPERGESLPARVIRALIHPAHRAARRAPGPCGGLLHGAGRNRLSDGCL